MTFGDKFRLIQSEERQRTLEQITRSDLPLTDTLELLTELIQACNAYVRRVDKYIDHRVFPYVLTQLAKEHEAVADRMRENGLYTCISNDDRED